jgi:RimJ/RimL family protein N-acetyltransferase
VTVRSVLSRIGHVCLVGDVTTPRLYGRAPVEEDLEDSVRIWTDPRVAEQAWPARLRTASDASRVLHASIAHWDRWGFGPWTVIERATGAIVGRVGLAHTRVAGSEEVEVAWFLSGDAWGRGYATEMAHEAVRVGFAMLELSDLVSFTTPPNAASQAVMRKLGFRHERDIEHAGLPHVLYRLLAGEWASPS